MARLPSTRAAGERSDLSVPKGAPVRGSLYDADAFGRFSEGLARFLGTGKYLFGQTMFVLIWIILNTAGIVYRWDPYPFILLNLAFSTQAAYAAPLILLAQTRQADRDKAHADADALHREELAQANIDQTARMMELLQQNTELTRLTQELSGQIKRLTDEIHRQLIAASS